jgi:hypothetical protein
MLEFSSDAASAKLELNIKVGDLFSGNNTNFGGRGPQSKASGGRIGGGNWPRA